MIRGKLGPTPFRVYLQPVVATIRYEDIAKSTFFMPDVVGVYCRIGQELQSCVVPKSIVDESKKTVEATLLGEQDNMILVTFPPTSFGQTKFSATIDELERIAAPS